MRPERAACAAPLILALLALAGCGDKVKMADVTGSVMLDGKPVEDGAILLVPVDGQAPTSGGTIEDGRYSIRAPVGTMKVSLSAPKVVGKKKIYDTPDSPEMPITKEALPPRYNDQTELTLEVKPGKNEKDFDLKSK